jgi:hypothetical protein
MADHRHTANDAWEALMTAHASLIRQFNAEDVWEDLSMKEYDVLYTLSKCSNPRCRAWLTGWRNAGCSAGRRTPRTAALSAWR